MGTSSRSAEAERQARSERNQLEQQHHESTCFLLRILR